MSIGDRIKKLRKDNNFTQIELAEKAGISEIAIRKYENGGRSPKYGTIIKIAEALNVPVDELMDFEELKQELSDIEETEKLLNILGYEIKINQIDDEVFEVDIKSKDGLITLSGEEYDKLKGNISLILDYELYKLKRQ
ncbi:helix-turn-helix domain-containing protein [Clostridium algidicarnis]|uniref:helix-turn-helix domain-containing protein n=1 Tax=Clostridium algidicarnis TaxID=37659 RepID=UPI001C0B8E6D|nr:helix-turn-helix domain-containing protein [Clostridium algidicarnis]MBU3208034.1 helix-turn-helix domain-containing protein [Clostridium algidicarnis]